MNLLKLLAKQGIQKDSHNSPNSPSQDKSKPKRRRIHLKELLKEALNLGNLAKKEN